MRVLSLIIFRISIIAVSAMLTSKAAAQQQQKQTGPSVNVSQADETTHLEFSGLKTWNYDIQKLQDGSIQLTLPTITAEAEAKLKNYSDSFIKSIAVQKVQDRTQIQLKLNQADIEHFDYMTDDPSLLIVDLYAKAQTEEQKAAKAAPKAPAKKAPAKSAAKNADGYTTKDGKGRKPASNELLVVEKEDPTTSLEKRFGAFDSSDQEYGRFQIKDYEVNEDAVLASKQNIYLKFPALIMPMNRLDHWMKVQPEYVITPKDNKETKEAELLYNLYLRGREAVFLKTYNYFKNKYPESEYSEILQNLVADVYMNRWRKTGKSSDYELAKTQLTQLVERHADSPLTQRNRFLLAYSTVERGEALPALESIQKLIALYPDSPEVPFLRFAEAESLMDLKKYDDAHKVYEKIIADFPNTSFAAQAHYRQGDVEMRSGNWNQAEEDYKKSLTALKKNEGDFPNAHFNRGEALFWLGRYKEATQEFAEFLRLFPTHPYGAYAMTRIGELFDIMGADKQRVMGAYLESYFRYPDEPGAKVARIRMLSGKMKSMKEKEFGNALKEIEELRKELDLEDTQEFITILKSQGYEDRGDDANSLKLLTSFYQKHPNSAHGPTVQKRVRRNIANEIKKKTDNGNYLGALKDYEHFSKTWLQGSDRIDVDYSRARDFELAGVLSESLKLYQKVAQRLGRIKGTPEEKTRRVEENLPSEDQLNLRIAKVLNDQREYVNAYKTLKQIENPKTLTPAESVERTQLMADLWLQRGDYQDAATALDLLVKDYQGSPAQLAPALLKQSQVKNQLKKYDEALKSADQTLAIKDASETTRSQAYNEKVKAQLELGLRASAIATLQDQLKEFDGKTPMESARYKLGELLFKEGDIQAAEAVWSRLKDSQSSVLWKFAEEKLKSAEFDQNYSRYIDRIPAMANEGEKSEKQ